MELRGGVGGLSRAWGKPRLVGTIRHRPEDFRVEEYLGFEPSGGGPHVLLKVEKTDCNTMDVVNRLASHGSIPVRDVGYSGLKDRHSVSTQWFSVPYSADDDWFKLPDDADFRVLQAGRHHRKLRRGTHPANRFRIAVRLDEPDLEEVRSRLNRIRDHGVPNYFGEQRFGKHFASNARRLAAGERLSRLQRSMTLSGIRSELFNRILERRVREKTWNRALPGEYVNLDGTRSGFVAEDDDPAVPARVAAMDLHPTALLAGGGPGGARQEAAALEEAVLAEHEQWRAVLTGHGLKTERRATRCVARGLEWRLEESVLTLDFSLRKGEFATSVLRELLDYRDVTRVDDHRHAG